MTRTFAPDTVLTMKQLAEALGRPTGRGSVDNLRLYYRVGRHGVKLEINDDDPWRITTTWGKWLAFCKRVRQAREAARQRRLAAVRNAGSPAGDRAAEARRKLEEMGMR